MASLRWCLQRGRQRGLGKCRSLTAVADEELLMGVLVSAPRAMQTYIKVPKFQVCFPKLTSFQDSGFSETEQIPPSALRGGPEISAIIWRAFLFIAVR